MPIYEYEREDGECEICPGRFEWLQDISDEPLAHCPWCGLKVKRVISKSSVHVKTDTSADAAAKKGFTTYKRSEEGVWEKSAGAGPDAIVGSESDKESIRKEKRKKTHDLDN